MALPASIMMGPPASIEEEEALIEENMRKCWHLHVPGPTLGGMSFGLTINPVVTGGAVIIIWSFVIACMASPDYMLKGMNTVAFGWIPEVWTWFYIVSQDVWILVLIYVTVISRYGNIKMGRDDEDPEFSTATWFAMLFSAGVAVGLFYYSVAEPMWHYKAYGMPRWHSKAKGYGNDDENALHAIMITWYHWGLHGWIPYTCMGAVMAIMTFRRGYPMTVRYIMWPIIGDRCYGWMGDTIDILSIVTTIAGVCTSLGLGAMQVNQGLQRLNHGFYRGQDFSVPIKLEDPNIDDNPACGGTGSVCADGKESFGIQVNVTTQIFIIIIISVVATVSVVSGVKNGVANLSRFNFALGMAICLMVLFMGETYYIMDTLVEAFGYYCWYIMKVGFYTDAFERLGVKDLGLGGAPDGRGGGDGWLSSWTLFYWGWWISWGPFMGGFLAKISRGRTIRQFVLGTLIVPTLYSFFWFGVFGAEGIRMQRMADAAGLCNASAPCEGLGGGRIHTDGCKSYSAQFSTPTKIANGLGFKPSCALDEAYHGGWGRCKEYAWTHHVTVGQECVETTKWVSYPCDPGAGSTSYKDPTARTKVHEGLCATKNIEGVHVNIFNITKDSTLGLPAEQRMCFRPMPDNLVCLWNQGTTDIFFDQLASYGPRGFTDLLNTVALVALILYFVTSSDSGSLIVDIISANGHQEPPVPQRIFWSLTEGTTAIALLYAGKNLPNSDGSLKALQSASMIAGLPYTFILFWCAQSLYLLAKEEAGELDPQRKGFSTFIFAINKVTIKPVLINTFAPGVGLGKIITVVGSGWPLWGLGGRIAGMAWGIMFQVMFVVEFIFVCITPALNQWHIAAWVCHIGLGVLIGLLRTGFRNTFQIRHGDMITDILCGTFAPMFTVAQMEVHVASGDKPVPPGAVGGLKQGDEWTL